MNTAHPHDLVDALELASKPPAERRRYVPIPLEAKTELETMTPEQRAAWLADHPADELRLRLAEEKRARRAEARASRLPAIHERATSRGPG